MVYTAPNGKKFDQREGSRAMVMHGTAFKTTGGLCAADLEYNNQGRIVSKRASKSAKRNNNLGDFKEKKGSGNFRLRSKSRSPARRGKSPKGGMNFF